MMNPNSSEKGLFINGRVKAFEILKRLGDQEKSNLLKRISVKNSRLAEELADNSYNFSQICKLSDNNLKMIFANVPAGIFGIAIRNLDLDFQKRALTLAHRSFAEKAYETLSMELSDEPINIQRAQSKISEIMLSLIKNKQIAV
jgi:flagellar motor switch protein FliG